MRPARMKLIVGGLVLLGAFGYLAASGVKSGLVYYLDVDQFVDAGAHPGERTRLHGTVGEGATALGAELTARFELVGATRRVPVEYRGVIPEMFAEGRQVVAEGAMDERGVFRADMLMTKCASKYEAPPDVPEHAK